MRGHGLALAAALALSLSAPAWALPVCERTPQVQLAIVNAAGVAGCRDAKDLSGITRLVLESAAMDSLKTGDFDGLPSLQVLELGGNRLTALPAGIFHGLASLRELWLGGNCLALPAGHFDGRGFDVEGLDEQDACEARSFLRGWRLHLLTSGEDG